MPAAVGYAGVVDTTDRVHPHEITGGRQPREGPTVALWFADRHAQPWRERLDRDRIDLGTGTRALVPNGRLDPTYRVT